MTSTTFCGGFTGAILPCNDVSLSSGKPVSVRMPSTGGLNKEEDEISIEVSDTNLKLVLQRKNSSVSSGQRDDKIRSESVSVCIEEEK